MGADEAGALWVPTTHCDVGANRPRYVILHGTGSSLSETAQNVAQFFQSNSPPTSTHYVIGRDGTVVQCVAEADAAWGNGVISAGADAWWTGDPNLVTISVEHVNDASNSTALSPAQQAASFALIGHICDRHGIPKRPADASGGVTGHYSIDPVNRARCPGNYPWVALFAALEGKVMWTQQSDGSYVDAGGHKIGTGCYAWLASHNMTTAQALADETWTSGDWAACPLDNGTLLTVHKTVDATGAEQFDVEATLASWSWLSAWQAQVALAKQVAELQAQLAQAGQGDAEAAKKAAAFDAIVAALATA
ncbi:MAG TPA: peptidoglycan recognition family protein [Ktedonobacterales bacterium]|nr:peptidoglycan recognition family protein [Ktedonobacterales bacterium]